tara:strand:- start:7932 stop:9062 length:1131 start_codon:yes stop_codon:yes gene_type:complete
MNFEPSTWKQIEFNTRMNLATEGQTMSQVILGPSGSGKSHWCKFTLPHIVADVKECDVADVAVVFSQPSVKDSQEYVGLGLPQKREDGRIATRFSIPQLLEEIEAALESGSKWVIVILDELAACNDDMQKTLAPMLDKGDRRLGDFPIPDNCLIYATGNRVRDRAGSKQLLQHLVNRTDLIELVIDHSEFIQHHKENGGHPLVIACAEANTDWFEESPAEYRSFCTYRSATAVSDLLFAFEKLNPEWDGLITRELQTSISYKIGPKAAEVLQACSRDVLHDIPSAEDIIQFPDRANVPNNTGYQMFAVNRAIANIRERDTDAPNNVFDYIARCRPDLQVSLGVKLCRATTRRGLSLTSDIANAFMIKHHDLISLTV